VQRKQSGVKVIPLMSVHIEKKVQPAHAKDSQTELLSDKDQSQQQSSSVTDSSKTDSTGTEATSVSQQPIKNDEGRETQNTTEEANIHLAEEEEKCEDITGNNAEQLTTASVISSVESSSMKEKDQSGNASQREQEEKNGAAELVIDKSEVSELAADNEPVRSGEISTEPEATSGLVAEEITCITDKLHPEAVISSENKPEQLTAESPSLPHTDDDNSAAAAASPTKMKHDTAETEVAKKQSNDSRKLSSSVKDTQGTVQRGDVKHSKRAQPQTKSGRAAKHLQHQVEKDRARDRKTSRERSGTNRTTDDRPRTRPTRSRRQGSYKQDESYSSHDRFKEQESGKKHGGTPERRDHQRREMKHRDYVSDLDDISSDEETERYKDGRYHRCWFCNEMCVTMLNLLEHLQAAAHEQVFVVSARCNIYISCLCYDVSVCLSVCDGSELAHYS